MLRLRSLHAGAVLHVTQRGHNRQRVFTGEDDYAFYLECLVQSADRLEAYVHAYVLMTNHVHLVMTNTHADTVPRLMQAVGRRYVRRFNARIGTRGTLWEGRYRSAIIDTDEYLLACMRYVELNPVRARLAPAPEAYRWSSFRANALGEPNAVVRSHATYDSLGRSVQTRREAYRALFAQPLDENTLHLIRTGTDKTGHVAPPVTLSIYSE